MHSKNRGTNTQETANTTEKNAAPPPSTCIGKEKKIVNEQAQNQVINDKEEAGGIL